MLELLTALPKRKELQVNSSRAQRVKTLAHELTDFLHRPDPDVQTKLQLFSKELYSTFRIDCTEGSATPLKSCTASLKC